jgi:hypothetical protein
MYIHTYMYIYRTSLPVVGGVSERSEFDAVDHQKTVHGSLNFDDLFVETIVFVMTSDFILHPQMGSFCHPLLRGFESASELYRSSDRRRSAKLVPTLADRGCHVVSATIFLTWSRYYFFQVAPQIVHEAEWTPFQTHCCSEKSGNAGNRTRDPCVSSQKLCHPLKDENGAQLLWQLPEGSSPSTTQILQEGSLGQNLGLQSWGSD